MILVVTKRMSLTRKEIHQAHIFMRCCAEQLVAVHAVLRQLQPAGKLDAKGFSRLSVYLRMIFEEVDFREPMCKDSVVNEKCSLRWSLVNQSRVCVHLQAEKLTTSRFEFSFGRCLAWFSLWLIMP